MVENNQSNRNKEFNHFRAWFIAAINLIPNIGGALASLLNSYTSGNKDSSAQIGEILKEIQSIKVSSQNHLHCDQPSSIVPELESVQQEDPPIFKQIASIPAGAGFFGRQREIWHSDLSIDGKYVAVVRYGRTGGKIYSAKTGELLQSIGGFPNGLYVHRPKVLFNPNVRNIPVIAVGAYNKRSAVIDIYWKYCSHKFKKKKSLYLSDDGDLDHLNSDGWSPDGRYYVSGSYSRQLDRSGANTDKYKMIIWDVFSDDKPFYVPVEGSLENGALFWHQNSRYLLVVYGGALVIDLQTRKYFPLSEVDDRLSALSSSEFHPLKPWLGATDGYDFYIIDIENKNVITSFNDAKEERVKVARKYKFLDHSSYVKEFQYYTSHLTFSPIGKYLATSDYFGNIVIRNCSDFSILHRYNIPNHARSNTMILKFLPCDEAGLIVDTCDESGARNLWFVDARSANVPINISNGMKFGSLQWCDVGIFLSKYKYAIDVYSFA